jgi:hypothetical protein
MAHLQTIDVAHPPLASGEAEAMLDAVLRTASLSQDHHVIKIVHGYGSTGKGGTLRTTVRNWAYRNRNRIRMILAGEQSGIFEPDTKVLLTETGLQMADLGPPGDGHTFIWIR